MPHPLVCDLKTSEKKQHNFTFRHWNPNRPASEAKRSPAHHLTNGAWNRSNAATSQGGTQMSSFYLILSKWERHIKGLLVWLIFSIRTLVCDLKVFHGLILIRHHGTQQSACHKNPLYPHPLRLYLTEGSHTFSFTSSVIQVRAPTKQTNAGLWPYMDKTHLNNMSKSYKIKPRSRDSLEKTPGLMQRVGS